MDAGATPEPCAAASRMGMRGGDAGSWPGRRQSSRRRRGGGPAPAGRATLPARATPESRGGALGVYERPGTTRCELSLRIFSVLLINCSSTPPRSRVHHHSEIQSSHDMRRVPPAPAARSRATRQRTRHGTGRCDAERDAHRLVCFVFASRDEAPDTRSRSKHGRRLAMRMQSPSSAGRRGEPAQIRRLFGSALTRRRPCA